MGLQRKHTICGCGCDVNQMSGGLKNVRLMPMDLDFNIDFDPETIRDLESKFLKSNSNMINSALGSPPWFGGFSIEQRVKDNSFVVKDIPEPLS